MSLPDFDVAPPDEPEFRAAVLHEFGHALGFLHQHPHPESRCAYVRGAIFREIPGRLLPLGFAQIDLNFKVQTYFDAPILGDEGPSIMRRPLAPWMLKDGVKDRCFAPPSPVLTAVDRKAAERAYPRRKQDQDDRNKDASDELANLATRDALPEETQALLSANGTLLASRVWDSPATAMSGGGGTIFEMFLTAVKDVAAGDVKPEYFRGISGTLQKSADQESRLFSGWIDDIRSYTDRLGSWTTGPRRTWRR